MKFIFLFLSLIQIQSFALEVRSVDTVAFGSCAKETKAQPIWDQILTHSPDLFLFAGDTIYGDTEDMNVLRRKYAELGAKDTFQRFRALVPILAVWDDHDYGVNDGGREYPMRVESQKIFLDFFQEPADSPRRRREGIYDSKRYQTPGGLLQIILLDTRYHRSPLLKGVEIPNVGPYLPNYQPDATFLGDDQWEWLEGELKKPADLRLIVSSIQFLSTAHRWEAWATMPLQRDKLMALFDENQLDNVIILSGDRHFGEISAMRSPGGRMIYDFTSSGLTHGKTYGLSEINPLRIGNPSQDNNYGLLKIDWSHRSVLMELHDVSLGVAQTHRVDF